MDYLFNDHETRPHHFLYPMFMAIIGGFFAHRATWEWVGYMIWGFAIVCTFWLFYSSYKKHQIEEIREHYYHDAEITKLDASRTTTKVVIDKSPLMGTDYQNFTEVNIPPGKVKKFAHGVLIEGRPLTIREWTPIKKGKEFSDPQWRRLIQFMKHPDWEDRHTKFIIPINPNSDQDSFELTAAGEQWLQDVLEDATVLTPTS